MEQDVWIAAGLSPNRAKVAAALRNVDLTPSDLGVNVNGWTVLQRVLRGEGAEGVARLLRATRKEGAG